MTSTVMLMAVPFAKIDRVFLTRHLTYIFSSSQCFIDGLFELFENLSRQDQKYPSVPFKSPIRNTQVGQPPFLLGMSRHDSGLTQDSLKSGLKLHF